MDAASVALSAAAQHYQLADALATTKLRTEWDQKYTNTILPMMRELEAWGGATRSRFYAVHVYQNDTLRARADTIRKVVLVRGAGV
jgi:hypothetical protein